MTSERAKTRKRAALVDHGGRAVQNTCERLKILYRNTSSGIIFFDRSGQVIDFNSAATLTLGQPLTGLQDMGDPNGEICTVGRDERPLPIEDYPPFVVFRTRSSIQNFVMGIYNPRLVQRRWYSVDAYPVSESGGTEPDLACVIFKDITEQRTADKELRQSKMHLALAQQIASVGSAAIDFRTGKWDWSDETFRIYGVEPGRFTPSAEALASLVHPDDWPALYANVPRARAGLAPDVIAEYRIRRPDGAQRILRRIATLVKDEAGNATGIVATVQDITDLRTIQEEKQTLQSQLYHAQRLDSLGTLASGIAHDLNNTLVPVVALSDTILQSMRSDDINRPLMELIKEGGDRASELVGQILAFARRQESEFSVIEIKPILEQTLRLARASVPASIRISVDAIHAGKVRGNQGQLHQILLNLFSNAAQAIGDEQGEITLAAIVEERHASGEDGPRRYVRITVRDSGCGMTEEVQSRIFEPFFTTKRVGTGTGLGLSVALGIIASHGGHIGVKSGPGQGSQFDVFLPLTDEAPAAS